MLCQPVAALLHAPQHFMRRQHTYGMIWWLFLGAASGLWLGTIAETQAQGLALTHVRGDPGDTVTVTVYVQAALNEVDAFAFNVTFDPFVLQYVDFQLQELVAGFAPAPRVSNPAAGRLVVAGFTIQHPIQTGQSGALVDLRFKVLRSGETLLVPERLIDDMASWAREAGSFVSITPPGGTVPSPRPAPVVPLPPVVSSPTNPTPGASPSGTSTDSSPISPPSSSAVPTSTASATPSRPAAVSSVTALPTESAVATQPAPVPPKAALAGSPLPTGQLAVASAPPQGTLTAQSVSNRPAVAAGTSTGSPGAATASLTSRTAPEASGPTAEPERRTLDPARDGAVSEPPQAALAVASESVLPGAAHEVTAALVTDTPIPSSPEKRVPSSESGELHPEGMSSGLLSLRLQAGGTLLAILLLGAVIFVLIGTKK